MTVLARIADSALICPQRPWMDLPGRAQPRVGCPATRYAAPPASAVGRIRRLGCPPADAEFACARVNLVLSLEHGVTYPRKELQPAGFQRNICGTPACRRVDARGTESQQKLAHGRSARSEVGTRRHAPRTTRVGAVFVRFILVCADVGAVRPSVWLLRSPRPDPPTAMDVAPARART